MSHYISFKLVWCLLFCDKFKLKAKQRVQSLNYDWQINYFRFVELAGRHETYMKHVKKHLHEYFDTPLTAMTYCTLYIYKIHGNGAA